MDDKPLKFIDLFAGCGGLSLGLEQAGFKPVLVSELNKSAAETYKINRNEEDFEFAQQHLRILSGLYGLLRPLDLIQPYRLEMGTRFENKDGKNLYEFWDNKISQALNKQLAEINSQVLVNLASNEYFSAVKPKTLKADIITPVFKDFKNDKYKIISFYAKKARGLMAAYIIKQRLTDVEQLKSFDSEGYYFSAEQSTAREWVFLRDAPV